MSKSTSKIVDKIIAQVPILNGTLTQSRLINLYPFLQSCSPPALVLSLSPGLGPDGLPSPGAYPRRGTVASNGSGSCAGSPPPYPGSGSINYQQQRHQRIRGSSGIHAGMSTATSDGARPNSGGASRSSPFNFSGSEIPNIIAECVNDLPSKLFLL